MDAFEKIARLEGHRYIAGIDEAGRGPLAGPVVAAAVIFPPTYTNPRINDSKKLTAHQREKLYEVIRDDALAVGMGVMEADVIDRVNILQATFLAMREAVYDLSLPPDFLLIDGLHQLVLEIPQKALVKGDTLSVSIAAASIIAKVSRDRIMEIYHRKYPQYNFVRNKGYATAEHRRAIEEYGICKIHRKSFSLKKINLKQASFEMF
ncbi:MAG TPA: ribonuclease HII [Smithellaceae bacterium]|jgi:ribonuclease HII|nr:MAG: Ribonuclease HII [Deltaproteobacteria bacterium ADurb.BinA014]HNQ17915.1 ribonuclease HII [Smithellaceae bacterium]HNZ30541.1 ribonuclease HII [Smithellaceae bacterium]HOD30424.1 ribonuclease HII [Smithellaceae bacterium]HPG52870.1 ribonuclease HII [Smithellaceae bacterium]